MTETNVISGNTRVIMVGIPDNNGVLNYVALESETTASYSGENEEIDIASKFDRHAKTMYGQNSDTLSLEAYGVRGRSTAQRRLANARKRLEYVFFRKGEWDGVNISSLVALEENYGNISSVEEEDGLNEARSFSVEATLQDDWIDLAPTAIAVSPTTLNLTAGGTGQLTATATYEDGDNEVTDSVVWSSSDDAIATVDQSGLVTAVAVGTATISATLGEQSGSSSVTVT